MKTSYEHCHFFPPDLQSLQNRSVIQKSNKNSGFHLSSLFHHKLTITFCNNMSIIKRQRQLHLGIMDVQLQTEQQPWIPIFARNTKIGTHILPSHQLKLDPSSTRIRAKVLLLSGGAKAAFKSQLSSPVTGLSLSSLQLGCDVSRT